MPHLHWPHYTEIHGVNRYEHCRCGARRLRRFAGYSPIRAGWPTFKGSAKKTRWVD